jgi:hypothetical protein
MNVERWDDASKVVACLSEQGNLQGLKVAYNLVLDLPWKGEEGARGSLGIHRCGACGE